VTKISRKELRGMISGIINEDGPGGADSDAASVQIGSKIGAIAGAGAGESLAHTSMASIIVNKIWEMASGEEPITIENVASALSGFGAASQLVRTWSKLDAGKIKGLSGLALAAAAFPNASESLKANAIAAIEAAAPVLRGKLSDDK